MENEMIFLQCQECGWVDWYRKPEDVIEQTATSHDPDKPGCNGEVKQISRSEATELFSTFLNKRARKHLDRAFSELIQKEIPETIPKPVQKRLLGVVKVYAEKHGIEILHEHGPYYHIIHGPWARCDDASTVAKMRAFLDDLGLVYNMPDHPSELIGKEVDCCIRIQKSTNAAGEELWFWGFRFDTDELLPNELWLLSGEVLKGGE